MKKILEKLKKWWNEQPTFEKELQTFREMQQKARQEQFAKYEQMTEKELLIEIAKNTYDW